MKFYVCAATNKAHINRWAEFDSLGQASHHAHDKTTGDNAKRLILQGEDAGSATTIFEVVSVTEVVFRLVAPDRRPKVVRP